jgi:hypothetical protein
VIGRLGMIRAKMNVATAALCAWGLVIAGCGSNGGTGEAVSDAGVEIPTQAEADAAAEAEITEENMEEALEQLSKEVEAELAEEG